MTDLHPHYEPHDHGMLAVGDGHSLYWESCGNPGGRPVLYLHGGPGSGASPRQRWFFDPDRFRAVLFDQRGCGRSRPLADDPDPAVLATQTTDHLLADIEGLRTHLGIDRWALVLGLSWGTTLALAYAQAHRERVGGLVLGLVTTTSRWEVEWVTEGVAPIFPEQWHRLAQGLPVDRGGRRLVDAYADALAHPDPDVRVVAAREWCAWEDAHVSLAPGARPDPRYEDAEFRFRFARLVTHYWRHHGFRGDRGLLDGAARLTGIPGLLIHGRFDVSSPLRTAWLLDRRWPTSRLVVLGDGGHGSGDEFLPTLVSGLAEIDDRSLLAR